MLALRQAQGDYFVSCFAGALRGCVEMIMDQRLGDRTAEAGADGEGGRRGGVRRLTAT